MQRQKTKLKITTFCALFWLFCGSGIAENLRDTIFAEADAVMAEAKQKKAYILSPVAYQKGSRLYKQADENLRKGKNLASIQRDLGKATEFLEKALEATKLANVTFASLIKAREDAKKAESLKYSAELWKEAEAKFIAAASKLEGGNVKAAKRIGAQAENIYRNAELSAIKGNYLNETKNLLARAERMKVYKLAPKTLEKAKLLLAKAEQALTENRYDIDLPRDLARQAKYEANHAIFLAKRLNRVREKQISMEELVLESEKPLIRIAGAADIVAELDKGYDKPTQEIIEYIERLQSQTRQQSQDIAEMESKLGSLASEQSALKKREKRRKQAERIERMFTRNEANVLRKGNDIILRLIGLNFASGKSEIEARNFTLLTKVQNAIRVFSSAKLVIEGHTDSFGSDTSNLVLSQKRAESVRKYLIANMNINRDSVSALGYGETRPVANNETPEGRRKNRRIDILIKPGL